MFARKALLGVVGAAALAASALVAATSAEAACARRPYVGEAIGIFYTTTGIAARADWRSRVRDAEGSEFALWSRSYRRTTYCQRRETGGRWHCRARAIPCDRRSG